MENESLKRVAALLRPVPDFPKPGILFWDIEPVLRDAQAVSDIIDAFGDYWLGGDIDVIAGFDARGFIFGSLLAYYANLPFVQIRKKGKLPGKTVSQAYALEYGEAEVEMIDDGFIAGKRVLLIDDLLATGGTALAGAQLVERLGGTVAGLTFVTELPELAGRSKLMDYPIHSLISIIQGIPYVGVQYCVDMLVRNHLQRDTYLLVKRLNEPTGYAMPGGHVEKDEGILGAAKRELLEETGCDGFEYRFHCVLTEPSRDPRGVKVSYVFKVFASTEKAVGESGKTEIIIFHRKHQLPWSKFVLGHEVAFERL